VPKAWPGGAAIIDTNCCWGLAGLPEIWVPLVLYSCNPCVAVFRCSKYLDLSLDRQNARAGNTSPRAVDCLFSAACYDKAAKMHEL
jgi:hypothetical protein